VLAGGEFYLLNPKDTAMLKAYSRARALINSLRTEEEGATAVEYGLIVALVSVVIVVAIVALVGPITAVIDGAVDMLPAAPEAG
jgi:pilus assembly protein Flp/PilA